MDMYLNKYGIPVRRIFYPISKFAINSYYLYFVLNDKADAFYKNKRNIGVVEEIPFIETGDYKGALELEIITKLLPDMDNDQYLFGDIDMTKYDMVIVQDNRCIIYDVCTKYDVDLDFSFFKEDYLKMICPFKELPAMGLN